MEERFSEAHAERIRALIDEEMRQPARWYLLSFALGDRFLGITIVRAHGTVTATRRAHELGVNPGGQVASYTFDRTSNPPAEIFQKLVTDKDDVKRILDTWGMD